MANYHPSCDSDFDWQDYVDVQVNDPLLEKELETFLNNLISTPEGQHLLKQIPIAQSDQKNQIEYALNWAVHNKVISEDEKKLEEQQLAFIPTKLIIKDNLPITMYSANSNSLNISTVQLSRTYYQIKDNEILYTNFHLEQAILHEMEHAIQVKPSIQIITEMIFQKTKARINEQESENLLTVLTSLSQFWELYRETEAVEAENKFMGKYYQHHALRGPYLNTITIEELSELSYWEQREFFGIYTTKTTSLFYGEQISNCTVSTPEQIEPDDRAYSSFEALEYFSGDFSSENDLTPVDTPKTSTAHMLRSINRRIP